MALPDGIYRIYPWGSHEHEGQILTLKDDNITLLPPGGAPENQEVTIAF